MSDFGPFSVDPIQVAALGGANFGTFVSRLLATETAAHGMAGTALETTYLENVGDGGVDAGLRAATGTRWLPPGDSAWQFKAGDLSPAKCKTELENATKAIEFLRAGGSYRLVLGASLTSAKIDARRAKLLEGASALGIADAGSRIAVIAADGLARWIEEFPALAVSPLLHSTGAVGQTFEAWSRSIRHTTNWVSSDARETQIAAVREAITGGTQLDVHLEGVSGLGKTRLVLESLRGQTYETLVVYSAAADSFPVTVLTHLQSQNRTAIVVIDECDRKQHEIYAQVLTIGTGIRLVTVGEPGGSSTRTPMISLEAFSDEAMQELLGANYPGLGPEVGRVVTQIAAGNIDYALKLAQAAIDDGPRSAGYLVTEDDIRAFFTDRLPDGQAFLASCALALFSRFGLDGESAAEIDTIAAGLGLSENDLRRAAADLQSRGLLSKQGRYRSVGPHPVAIYLAAKGWEEFGTRIVADLLPLLEPNLTERLFRRAAELGEIEATSSAMHAVLASDGPVGSLESIADGKNASLLPHFAVLSPEAVSDRLAELIGAASEQELRHAREIRRDLVWSLEKIAWHSKTFAVAADSLLRLAIAENESYSNNASGTWVELFGAFLPGTAAPPNLRIAYLQVTAESHDPRVRSLAVLAAARAIDSHESILVAGEVQGGAVVEPRGVPATYGDVWEYRNFAIDVLADLTTDLDREIADSAAEHLVASMHGLLAAGVNREHLGKVIAELSSGVVLKARVQVEELRLLFDRADVQDSRPANLAAFEAQLPKERPSERLAVLGNTRTWDRDTHELAKDLVECARMTDESNPSFALIGLLESAPDIPAAYAIGHAIQLLGVDYVDGVSRLSRFAGMANGESLLGFLHALENQGDMEAFDRYLDSANLLPRIALQYSVRGARTPAAARRVADLVPQVTVVEAARALFVWMRDADQAETAGYLGLWASRLTSQADYNASVDFAAMQVFRKPEPLPDLDAVIFDLIPRRLEYPNVGQESWDWSTLVRRQLESDPLAVANLLADLVEADALNAFSGSEEGRLLQDAVQRGGEDVWVEMMNRIQRGEWRLSFSVREWLGNSVTINTARFWVDGDLDRARILANVTTLGGASLAPIAEYLLEDFGKDEQVSSYLVGHFISGVWSGNESDRIASQISEVQGWVAAPGQSVAVKSWGRRLIASLQTRRHNAIQEEEESGR